MGVQRGRITMERRGLKNFWATAVDTVSISQVPPKWDKVGNAVCLEGLLRV